MSDEIVTLWPLLSLVRKSLNKYNRVSVYDNVQGFCPLYFADEHDTRFCRQNFLKVLYQLPKCRTSTLYITSYKNLKVKIQILVLYTCRNLTSWRFECASARVCACVGDEGIKMILTRLCDCHISKSYPYTFFFGIGKHAIYSHNLQRSAFREIRSCSVLIQSINWGTLQK